MDYSDLKQKTVFDLTDNEDLIFKTTGRKTKEDKDDYIYLTHPVNRMRDIIRFCDLTGNKELEKLAQKALKIVTKEWHDSIERQERENPGLIVD